VKLKKGAFVVSVSYAIPHKEFEMCDYCEYEMNFGLANVFIQQKTTDPHDYVEPVEIEEEEDDDEQRLEDEADEEEIELNEDEVELATKAINGLFG
jgi:hypothetical protein